MHICPGVDTFRNVELDTIFFESSDEGKIGLPLKNCVFNLVRLMLILYCDSTFEELYEDNAAKAHAP